MAPKPLNHKILNFKNVANGFPIPEYPNKHRICIYKKYSLSINAKYKLAFFFFGLLGNKSSRILSRPWFGDPYIREIMHCIFNTLRGSSTMTHTFYE